MKTVTVWLLTGRALTTMTRVSLSTWCRRHVCHVTTMIWTRWGWWRAAVTGGSVPRPVDAASRVDWVSAGADTLYIGKMHVNLMMITRVTYISDLAATPLTAMRMCPKVVTISTQISYWTRLTLFLRFPCQWSLCLWSQHFPVCV